MAVDDSGEYIAPKDNTWTIRSLIIPNWGNANYGKPLLGTRRSCATQWFAPMARATSTSKLALSRHHPWLPTPSLDNPRPVC